MGAGDTISGVVTVRREDTQGNKEIVAPEMSSDRVDHNVSKDAEEKLYLNTRRSDRVTRPAGAEDRDAPDAIFAAGEVLYVSHKSASLEEAIDHDADSFDFQVLVLDRNRGRIYPKPVTVADQELSADPDSDTGGYVDFFQVTVPDRQEWRLVGSFEVAAEEAA